MAFKTHMFGAATIYECPWCPFDDEKEVNVKVHIVRLHPDKLPAPPPPTERAPEATLYRPDGAVVTAIPIPAADAAEMSEDIDFQPEER